MGKWLKMEFLGFLRSQQYGLVENSVKALHYNFQNSAIVISSAQGSRENSCKLLID